MSKIQTQKELTGWCSGHCCYSCRAFFRRTVQRINKKGLKRCKTGRQNCEVSSAAKSCIHCRYTKCLSIGMVPELLQGKRKQGDKQPGDQDQEEEEGSASPPETAEDRRSEEREEASRGATGRPGEPGAEMFGEPIQTFSGEKIRTSMILMPGSSF